MVYMEVSKHTTDYPYRVVYPSQKFLEGRGFGRVAHLPFIMDSRPGYHRIANQFLIDLGLGEWSAGTRGLEQASTMPPTRATMHNYAHWLSNYLEYCHARGKDPLKADYKIDFLPTPKRLSTPYGDYNSYTKVEEKKIIYTRRFQLNSGHFKASEYNDFYEFVLAVNKADNVKAMLVK